MTKVLLIGNLTRDPELTETAGGVSVCRFGVAVNRYSGQEERQTDFYNVTAWRRLGETVARYTKKGHKIAVYGDLQIRQYEGNDGVRIAETPSGILNCVGLQNPGVEAFIERELPFMRESGAVVIANAAGSSLQDYEKNCERLSETEVDMIKLNIS